MYNEVLYFLPVFIGGLCTVLGFQYKNNTAAVFGGLFFFLYSVAIIIVPLPLISDLLNIILASICFGFGSWLMFVASIQELEERGVISG